MGELITTRAQLRTRRISDRLRVTLGVVRALAATYVVLHHVVVHSDISGPVSYLFRFGQEAVIVFFLLSGFLIFASEQARVRSDLRGYYLRRLRRIYPLLFVAMALTAGVVWANGTLAQSFRLSELAVNLVSLQDVSALKPGVIGDPFLGNSPLWSLSYEVFFYLAFPLIMILRRISRQHALAVVGGVSVLGYGTYLIAPNHFSLVSAYLLVWWAGAVVADLYRSRMLSVSELLPTLGLLGLLCGTALAGVVFYGRSDVGVFPMLPLRHFAFALLCILLCGTALTRLAVRVASPMARPATYVASISYGLYVLHYPLLIQWEGAKTPGGFALAVLVLLTVSILGDRMLDKLLPRPSQDRPPGRTAP